MLLCLLHCGEGTKVASFPGRGILLLGVQAEFSAFQFANHEIILRLKDSFGQDRPQHLLLGLSIFVKSCSDLFPGDTSDSWVPNLKRLLNARGKKFLCLFKVTAS